MNKCGKGSLILTFDTENGHLTSTICAGRELLAEGETPALIRARFRDAAGQAFDVDTSEASCSVTKAGEGYLHAAYSDFARAGISLTFMVRESDDGALLFRAEAGCGPDLVAEWLEYPRLTMKNNLKGNGGDGEILWPYNEGALIDDLALRERTWFKYREPEYPSQGLYGVYPNMVQSQFMACLFGGGGLYIGAHDPDFGLKVIDIRLLESGYQPVLRIYAGCGFGESFRADFDLVLAPFAGDWHDAAELYRTWFDAHRPQELLPIAANKSLPAWYDASPVVVTYPVRGLHDMDQMTPNRFFPYANALPVIDRLSQKLDCPILVLLMHWEGTAPWAPPFVWPPFGGKEGFDQFADALHASGNLLGVYCSGIGFTMQSNLIHSFSLQDYFQEHHMADAMCLSPAGVLEPSAICTGQRSGYDLCPGSAKTHALMVAELEKMLQSGIDYIQILDQNHGGGSYLCYAKNHTHAPVPGKKQVQDMHALHQSLKKKAGQVLLGCESGAAEPFLAELPFSDNRFNLNFIIGRPVPLYAFLYHEYVNNFMGNQVCTIFRPDEANLLYRLAYAFVAGDMLTLVLTDDGRIMQNWGSSEFTRLPDQEAVLDLVANLNDWRTGIGERYLHLGRMVKPAAIACGLPNTFDLQDRTPYVAERLLTSRWIAADHNMGQIIVNYNREEVTFSVESEMDRQGPRLYRRSEKDEIYTCGKKIVLPPLSACLLIWEVDV